MGCDLLPHNTDDWQISIGVLHELSNPMGGVFIDKARAVMKSGVV